MKKIVLYSILGAMAFLSGGCTEKQTVEQSKTVNLSLHVYKQENQDGLKKLISVYEEKNPGVKIQLNSNPNGDDTENSRRADEGDLPDILQMQSYSRVMEYASRGLIMDLSGNSVLKDVLPSSLTAVSWNGKVYAVPMDYAGIGIIYNKKVFENCGIEPPETYRQLQNACSVLKSKGIVPFSALLKESWSMGHILTLLHTALLKEKNISPDKFITDMNAGKGSYGQVNTNRLFGILDFYGKNISSDAAEMDGSDQQKAFASGKCAMMIQGLWAYVDAMKINPALDAGFIPFPVYEDPKMNVFYADVDSVFGISSQSSPAKQKAALDFLEWLLSTEGQKLWMSEYKLIPPVKGVDVSNFGGPYVDLMKSVEQKGSMQWAFSQYPSVAFDGYCKDGTQKYMLGQETQANVIKTIDKQWSSAVTK